MFFRTLRDLPGSGWGVVTLAVVRSAALACAALLTGRGIDLIAQSAPAGVTWALAAGLLLVAALAAGAEAYIPPAAQGREEARWRQRVARKGFAEPIDSAVPAGTVVARAGEEVERFAHYRTAFLGPLVAAFVVPVVVLLIIGAAISAGLAVGLAVCTAVIPPMVAWFFARFRASSGRYRMLSGRLTATFLESMRVRHTVRALGAVPSRRERLAKQAEAVRQEVMRLLRRNQLVILATDALFGIVVLAVLGTFAVAGTAAGWLTPGAAVSLLLLSGLLREPVDRLGRSFYVGLAGRAAGDRVMAFLEDPARDDLPADAPEEMRGGVTITLDDVHVRRGEALPVRGVNLTIPERGLLAIVGRSGAGKSSLAMAIAGLIAADGILLGGEPASAHQLRRAVSTVPQRVVFFRGTVRENLHLAAPDAGDETLHAALRRAGFSRGGHELPHGLDTRVGEGASGVSGGQAQRISIARVLLTGSPVIVADEPTANLDPVTSLLVLDTLRDLARDHAVVMISHRPDEAARADRIVTLAEGRVAQITEGRPA
ncbi:ABC transporter ATP-binding protein [Microbacterium amylolyticum]|uniref:ATP-binding cassette subfamily C protein n=1 Tax=Microbacterium amylolyticum TaxID=936337 RepID=A0ABS4ZFH6_9MICO|nr:ABC transporter ATP-binding protein [Microbacterium amylolyticum]MBP2436026.1 ATP-binding cassette subfamily C protein [Microbacterium amylolyticum]